MPSRTYIAIDLKSFYASVECTDRQLDPLTKIWWSPTSPGRTKRSVSRSPRR